VVRPTRVLDLRGLSISAAVQVRMEVDKEFGMPSKPAVPQKSMKAEMVGVY